MRLSRIVNNSCKILHAYNGSPTVKFSDFLFKLLPYTAYLSKD